MQPSLRSGETHFFCSQNTNTLKSPFWIQTEFGLCVTPQSLAPSKTMESLFLCSSFGQLSFILFHFHSINILFTKSISLYNEFGSQRKISLLGMSLLLVVALIQLQTVFLHGALCQNSADVGYSVFFPFWDRGLQHDY